MISSVGQFALSAAMLVSAGAVLASVASIRLGSRRWLAWAGGLLGFVFVLVTLAMGVLLVALITNQFGIEYVAEYSERAMPIGYKIAALWAGQNGSLLLWAWLLSGLSLIAAVTMRHRQGSAHAWTIMTLAGAGGFFAALLLFAADPFASIGGVIPADGNGLNPMLQNIGMILHPPLLFMGYAGFTIPFALLVGVLIARERDNRWLSLARPWLMMSWLFLTAGILLGAWWAYVELGWGGYWAWDPVENASLLPWLTSTALLHSIMVQQHRGMFKRWNAALIGTTFILCIFGTYLTRSGVISSVHAFQPSMIGTFFLVLLALTTFGGLALFIWRFGDLAPEHRLEGLVSREGAFLLGNVLLVIMTAIVLVGTVFPLLSGLWATEPVTVKAPFYNSVVGPMAIILVGLMSLGPVLAFGRSAARRILVSLRVPAAVAGVVVIVAALAGVHNSWVLVSIGIAALGTVTVIVDFARSVSARRRSTGEQPIAAAVRLIDRNHRRYGGQLAHLGLMMVIVGVAVSSLYARSEMLRMEVGQSASLGPYSIQLDAVDEVRQKNFTAVQATLSLTAPGGQIWTLRPQKRLYDKWGNELNTEVAVRSNPFRDVYVVLAGWESGGKIVGIQAMINPMVLWIWIGGIVMGAGGLFGVLPRLLPATEHAARSAAARTPVGSRRPNRTLGTMASATLES